MNIPTSTSTPILPPIAVHPSARSHSVKSHPNWVLVSELSSSIWVVIATIQMHLPQGQSKLFPEKWVTLYEVFIWDDLEGRPVSFHGQHRNFASARDRYFEAIEIAIELYV